MYLQVKHLQKNFEDKKVVSDVNFQLEKGKLLCLLGSSGCGKTTTLNMIGGFLDADSGEVILDNEDILHIPSEQRPTTTVFQSYSLFPHMTVLENVIYGLKFKHVKKKDAIEKGRTYLELVGLSGYENSYINHVSGGQQQRIALARALIVEPKLLLLDEPFCNLDANLRVKMRAELKRIQAELNMTMIFVTHDQEEAMVIADEIAVMQGGEILQIGTPESLYREPATDYVREFLDVDSFIWEKDGSVKRYIK